LGRRGLPEFTICEFLNTTNNQSTHDDMKKILYVCAGIAALMLLMVAPEMVSAQPGLPQPPNQAPIDGGLGLLAAAGGAYAWKKLRNKKHQE
jgi:hypothetical protein